MRLNHASLGLSAAGCGARPLTGRGLIGINQRIRELADLLLAGKRISCQIQALSGRNELPIGACRVAHDGCELLREHCACSAQIKLCAAFQCRELSPAATKGGEQIQTDFGAIEIQHTFATKLGGAAFAFEVSASQR